MEDGAYRALIKYRTLPMPESIIPDILVQVEQVKKLHTKFIEDGYDGVLMFDAMDRKSKYAAREFN